MFFSNFSFREGIQGVINGGTVKSKFSIYLVTCYSLLCSDLTIVCDIFLYFIRCIIMQMPGVQKRMQNS